jgi:HAMP domain-containing protein
MLRYLDSILKKFKLGKRFTILLLLVFASGVVISGAALATVLNHNAEDEISSKAHILIGTMSSVRDYTSTQIRPELTDKLEAEFLPQVVPAYSAREVFEKLRADKAYREFFYKEATLNPTNLRDKADNFETTIVERFRTETNLKELRGFRSLPGGDFLYIARPLAVSKPSCLECHTTPDVAPKSMIERYGTANGFGWKLNEIIGAQIISVPARTVLQSARQSFVLIMGIVVGVFAAAILMVNFWLKRYVVRPLNRMVQVAEAVSTGDTDAEFERVSNDEVGSIAEAFTRMKTSLTIAMKRLEKYRIGRRSSDFEETLVERPDIHSQ